MTNASKPHKTRKPPRGLTADSRKFWVLTVAEYDFETGAQLDLLDEYCFSRDRLREIRAAISKHGVTGSGYNGQMKQSPLLPAEDACVKQVMALARALKLSGE